MRQHNRFAGGFCKKIYSLQTQRRNRPLPDLDVEVNIVINNAGSQTPTMGACTDMLNNYTSTFRVTEKYGVQPSIRSILMISSASAITGAEFPEYCASKGAMSAYGKNVAHRVARYGATCNNLCLGGVITPLNQHILDDAKLTKRVLNETLLKKWATVEEVSEWIYFLTVTNSFCTGQDILVDGGEHLKSNFIW